MAKKKVKRRPKIIIQPPPEETVRLLNFCQISLRLTGLNTGIQGKNKRNPIPKNYWRDIDDIIYQELPTWWHRYKLYQEQEHQRKVDENMKGNVGKAPWPKDICFKNATLETNLKHVLRDDNVTLL